MKKNIAQYINRLEGFKTAIKNLHWNAKKMSEHEFMDNLEDILSNHQDDVAEIAQGVYGIKITNNELQPKAYKITSQKKTLQDILNQAELFYQTIQNNKRYIGLRSKVEEFLAELNKQAYLLDMCLAEARIRQAIREGILKYGTLIN